MDLRGILRAGHVNMAIFQKGMQMVVNASSVIIKLRENINSNIEKEKEWLKKEKYIKRRQDIANMFDVI